MTLNFTDDTLRISNNSASKESLVSITDVLSEGPIAGLVDGTSSVFLNNISMEDARLRSHAPVITESDTATGSVDSGQITFNGSSNVGVVSAGSVLPDDLVFTSGGNEYARYLVIRNLLSVELDSSEIQCPSPPGIGGLPPLALREKMALITQTKVSDTLLETLSDTLKDAVMTDSYGTKVQGQIDNLTAGDNKNVFTSNTNLFETFTQHSSFGYPITIRIRKFFKITAISGQNVTVDTTPPAGTYPFEIGQQPSANADETTTGDISDETPIAKFNNVNIQFRDGRRQQLPMAAVPGVGHGTAIPAVNIGSLANNPILQANSTLQAESSVGTFTTVFDDPADPGLTGTATFLEPANFGPGGMTLTQIQAADQIIFSIQYPNGLKNVSSTDGAEFQHHAVFHMSIQLTFINSQNNTATTDFMPIFASSDGTSGRIIHQTKSNSAVEFQHTVHLDHFRRQTNFTSFKIRIIRLSPSTKHVTTNGAAYSNTDDYQDLKIPTRLSQATVQINDLFRYPHTAHANISFSSRTFDRAPQRSYEVKGMLVQIPTTYTPRESNEKGIAKYQGFWNGTFRDKLFYTDNPAWIFYDLVNNKRYGAGEYLDSTQIDKYDLYRVAQYCDEIVDDGTTLTATKGTDEVNNLTLNRTYIIKTIGNITNWGSIGTYITGDGSSVGDVFVYDGTTITTNSNATSTGEVRGGEPRFRMNLYLSKATAIFKVLKDMTSMFTSMLYWMDGKLATIIDAPSDPVYTFTKGNVLGGAFKYESTSRQTRHNQIVVTYNEPSLNYKPTPILVEDREAVLREGKIISTDAVAFGCTSESQAYRFGKWKLFTAQNQKELISFATSLTANFLRPGDIINVQDADRTGRMLSGRVKSVSADRTQLTFDRQVPFVSGPTYTLSTLVKESAAYYVGVESITEPGTGATINRGDKLTKAYVHTPINVTATLTNGRSYKIVTVGNTDFTNLNSANTVESNEGFVFVSDGSSGSGTGTVVDLANPTLVTITTEAQASNAYLNSNGTELLPLKWAEHTNVQEHAINNPGAAASTVTLASSATFGAVGAATIPSVESIWAVKEEQNSFTTKASPKQYKILNLSTEKNETSIQGVEHFNEKYDAVDKDYAISKPAITNYSERPTIVPTPKSISVEILNTTSSTGFSNLRLSFVPPDNAEDNNIDSYDITHTLPIEEKTVNTSSFEHEFNNVGPGDYVFRVRSVLASGEEFSSWISYSLTLESDDSPVQIARLPQQLPKGGIITGSPLLIDSSGDGNLDTYRIPGPTMSGAASPDNTINVATEANRTQSFATMTANTTAHIVFDHSENDTTNTLRLMTLDETSLTLPFYRDIGTGNTAITSGAFTTISGTYTITEGTNTFTKSSSVSNIAKGDILVIDPPANLANLSNQASAVVSKVESTKVTLDRTIGQTYTSVSIKKVTFKPQINKDASFATITKPSSGQATLQSFTVPRSTPLGDNTPVENLTGAIGATTADGLEIIGGGLIFDAGGKIRSKTGSTIKPDETNTQPGFFLGYNNSSTKYTFGFGDGAGASSGQFIKWDGTDLTISGATLSAATIDSVAGGAGLTFIQQSDTPNNFTGASEKFVRVNTGSGGNGTALEFIAPADVRTAIGAGTSSFDGAFSSLSSKPTTIAGYGITDAFDGAASSLSGNIDLTSQVTGILPVSNMAATALTTIQTASSQSAQLALTTQEGDVVVRSDLSKTFMRNSGTAGSMADFTELATPTDVVTSVNGNTGAVTAPNTFRTIEVDTNGNGSADETLGATETLRLKKGNNITLTESGGVVTITAASAGSGSIGSSEIADDSVTNAKLANMAVNTVKGRITSGTGDPEDLTAANLRTIINVADGATVGATTAQVTAIGLNTAKTSANNSTITISQTGISDQTFTLNQSGNTTITLADTNTDTNTQNQYAISCVDGDNSDEEKIRLSGSGHNGNTTDDIVLEAGTGLSIARSGDKITFTNTDGGSGAGTVTSVGTNTGLSGTITTSGSLSLALNDLSAETADIVGGSDHVIYLDGGSQKKKLFNQLKLSQFNNDAGFATTSGVSGSISSAVNDGTLRIFAGDGMGTNIASDDNLGSFTANQSSGTDIVINHANTSDQSSSNNSGRTYIQDITLDTYGHVTGLATATETVTNTDQTITLSGDVSGSGTTSINVTVADDSHNHVISNVDGLQSALNGKQASGTYVTSVSGSAPVVSSGGTTPAISVTTAAVADGGASLATGDQIYDHVTSRISGLTGNAGTITSVATTAPITGGTVTSGGVTIGINEATTSLKGAMSTADKTKLDIFSVSGVTDIPLNQTFGNIAAKLANFETLNATTANVDFLNANRVISRDIRVGPDDTINATATVNGRQYTITTVGNTDFTAIGADSSTVGVLFTATGAGLGTGTVRDYNTVALIGADGTTLSGKGAHLNSAGDFFVGVHDGARIFFDQSAGTFTLRGVLTVDNLNAAAGNFGTLSAEVATIGTLNTSLLDSDVIMSRDIRVGPSQSGSALIATSATAASSMAVDEIFIITNLGSIGNNAWSTLAGTTTNSALFTYRTYAVGDIIKIATANGSLGSGTGIKLTGTGSHLTSAGDFLLGDVAAEKFLAFSTATNQLSLSKNIKFDSSRVELGNVVSDQFVLQRSTGAFLMVVRDGVVKLYHNDAPVVKTDGGGLLMEVGMNLTGADSGHFVTRSVKAKDSNGLSLRTDDNLTRLFIADSGVITFNNAYSFPTADGSANQVLQTDGSGTLTFATVSASDSTKLPLTGGTLSGALTVTGDLTLASSNRAIGSARIGLKFQTGYNEFGSIYPYDVANSANSDNKVDLGQSNVRFDDVYATNGTIQTSDINEKQDIRALTDAETRVAIAAKSLLKVYRWKNRVTEVGANARLHFGIIAQELQTAFEAEGLDAGDYGMFISNTWTDDSGNEQTRLGVRYSELLAFIIAST